jgi:hypothetical protein
MIGWNAIVNEGSATSDRQAPHFTLAIDIFAPMVMLQNGIGWVGGLQGCTSGDGEALVTKITPHGNATPAPCPRHARLREILNCVIYEPRASGGSFCPR